MEKIIRFGIIGTSSITKHFLEAAVRNPGFQLTAVYSRNLENARAFGAAYDAEYFYDDLEQLASSEHVDAVYIASPNSFHCSQAMEMMRAGKHVLCEKPMASNQREVELMMKTAKEHQVVLLEAMRSLFDPGMQLIRENLPNLGAVRRATLQFCKISSRYDDLKQGKLPNIFRKDMSAGALMDIGVYCVHPLIYLFGIPYDVRAEAVYIQGKAQEMADRIDGAGSVLAAYPGMVAELIYSKITDTHLPSQIQGEEGCMIIEQIPDPKKLTIYYRDGREEVIVVEKDENNMSYELEFFMQAIHQGKEYSHGGLTVKRCHDVSRKAIALMDEVRVKTEIVFPADEEM